VLASVIGVIVLLAVILSFLRLIGPALRTLPRPARVPIALIVVLTPLAIAYAAARKRGIGMRESGLVGAVLLVENLPMAAARKRVAALMRESGGLRNAVQ